MPRNTFCRSLFSRTVLRASDWVVGRPKKSTAAAPGTWLLRQLRLIVTREGGSSLKMIGPCALALAAGQVLCRFALGLAQPAGGRPESADQAVITRRNEDAQA